jgi:hypothetical protein
MLCHSCSMFCIVTYSQQSTMDLQNAHKGPMLA